jgi:hypothetical protein
MTVWSKRWSLHGGHTLGGEAKDVEEAQYKFEEVFPMGNTR